MFDKEKVEKILEQAERLDPKFELFGVSEHRYKLKPPVDLAFVREMEENYHFRIPEDYVQFITEVGDGGAGPGYGLSSFGFYRSKAKSLREEKWRETYLYGLGKELYLLPIEPEDVEDFCVFEEDYEKNPEKYFMAISETYNSANDMSYGFFTLGTYGCGKDFGLVITGERYGQVFSVTPEGGYELLADSFQGFYQKWLDYISDAEQFQKELDMWRGVKNR